MKTPTKSIKCMVCRKTFGDLNKLKQHMNVHSEERRFQCEICGNAFRFRSNLGAHMATHSETPSCECSICGKTTRQKNNLRKHMMNFHNLKGNQLEKAMNVSVKKEIDDGEESTANPAKKRSKSTQYLSKSDRTTRAEARRRRDEEKEILDKPTQQNPVETVKVKKEMEKNEESITRKRKLTSSSENPSAKRVKVENPGENNLGLKKKEASDDSSIEVKPVETIQSIPDIKPPLDQDESLPRLEKIHQEQNQQRLSDGFQVAHFQSPVEAYPMGTAQFPSPFEEDARQISHQVLRVAGDLKKDRRDYFRQLMFATIFAFEGAESCGNVGQFFRMMGERYARK